MNKQGKNGIGWTDYTINPVKGRCLGGCFYCYATQMYDRFKWNKEIRFVPEELDKIATIKKPSKFFICSTHDIFGEWILAEWLSCIIKKIKEYPQHTFQFLTKLPSKYNYYIFPDNCWLGATTVNANTAGTFTDNLGFLSNKTFISAEPLLEDISGYIDYDAVNWIIVGKMTGKFAKQYRPKRKWIENIVRKAKKNNIPVFLKNNLQDIWKDKLIQENPC